MKPARKITKAAAIWKSGFRRTGNVIGNCLCDDRFACFQPPGITVKKFLTGNRLARALQQVSVMCWPGLSAKDLIQSKVLL